MTVTTIWELAVTWRQAAKGKDCFGGWKHLQIGWRWGTEEIKFFFMECVWYYQGSLDHSKCMFHQRSEISALSELHKNYFNFFFFTLKALQIFIWSQWCQELFRRQVCRSPLPPGFRNWNEENNGVHNWSMTNFGALS